MAYYKISASLNVKDSFDIRKFLYKNGFKILLIDAFTLESVETKEEYNEEFEKLPPPDNGTYEFLCMYSSPKRPPEQVFNLLITANPAVVKQYSICYNS